MRDREKCEARVEKRGTWANLWAMHPGALSSARTQGHERCPF